jgi:hypothetical protein
MAAVTKGGKRKILLVNKRNHDLAVAIPGASGGHVDYVDVTSGWQPPATAKLTSESVTLHGFSVAVVTLP